MHALLGYVTSVLALILGEPELIIENDNGREKNTMESRLEH